MPVYFELRVELQQVRPAIWRRFLIRSEATFAELHEAIQVACGWGSKHLYAFYAESVEGEPIASVPDEEDPLTPDAQQVHLAEQFGSLRSCVYLYDFGDAWELRVSLEEVQILPARFSRKLVGGARAFPPEDCGGLPGYADCVALLGKRTPLSADQRELRQWLGEWEPERFELEQVARAFDRPKARRSAGA